MGCGIFGSSCMREEQEIRTEDLRGRGEYASGFMISSMDAPKRNV